MPSENLTTELARCQIRVTGVVQGVGYRPFTANLARRRGLTGWVRNDPQGVLIEAGGEPGALTGFAAALKDLAPELARVTGVSVLWMPATSQLPDPFEIRSSGTTGRPDTIVPADSHVCADCLRELFTPGDRRHRYPFINCTNCGPRYSLIRGLPYDRAQTTMADFIMCERCRGEYEDVADRRYHAQPNACPACGPSLMAATADGERALKDEALDLAVRMLAAGQIVAVKSVGGYHLAVDARQAAAVGRLRRRKKRDAKPFALMVRDLATADRLAEISAHEAELLTSPARPIVLVRKRRSGGLPEAIAPRSPNLGLMLPSAPLHHLLLAEPGLEVLVMTSGNVSGRPIVFRDEDALAELCEVADLILYHDRGIEIRVDDSVLRSSLHPDLDEPVLTFLRRSRGYAPYPIEIETEVNLPPIVAYGAELKTTVAITSGRRAYLSQHIGDLKNDETFASHSRTAQHLTRLHDLRPAYAACDLHPDFRSTRSALVEHEDRVYQVQHHHAHMASCMAENRLAGTTLGVVFDGAGYGLDGTIWGGEFLLGDYADVRRVAHLRRLRLIGGDMAVREPIRTAFALALDALGDSATSAFPVLRTLSSRQREVYEVMAHRGVQSPLASSMGRLFDGVAALLGICTHAEYEAHGPIELEGLLGRSLDPGEPYPFDRQTRDGMTELDSRPAVRRLADGVAAGTDLRTLSLGFHSGVVAMVVAQCEAVRREHGVEQVVLSGGVFLNEFVLVNCLVELRRAGFAAYSHRQVPPNDGGIALGQVMVAGARIARQDRSFDGEGGG